MVIAVVSDLHVGHVAGLLPPRFIRSDGSPAVMNKGQQWLWQQWEAFGREAARFEPDVLVVNGDVVDGGQHRQGGAELCLPVLEDQAQAAVECLARLARVLGVKRIFGVQGTEYHDGRAAAFAERVYERLGASRYKGDGDGRWSREVLQLKAGRAVIHFAHHIGVGRASVLDRESLWALEAGASCTAIVRSHVHRYAMVEDRRRKVITTPCWQLQTRFMRKHGVFRMRPDIGGIILIPDRKTGEVVVKRWLYELPEVEAVSL